MIFLFILLGCVVVLLLSLGLDRPNKRDPKKADKGEVHSPYMFTGCIAIFVGIVAIIVMCVAAFAVWVGGFVPEGRHTVNDVADVSAQDLRAARESQQWLDRQRVFSNIIEPEVWAELDRRDFRRVCQNYRRAKAYSIWSDQLGSLGSQVPAVWSLSEDTEFMHRWFVVPRKTRESLEDNAAIVELADAFLTYDVAKVEIVYGKFIRAIKIGERFDYRHGQEAAVETIRQLENATTFLDGMPDPLGFCVPANGRS